LLEATFRRSTMSNMPATLCFGDDVFHVMQDRCHFTIHSPLELDERLHGPMNIVDVDGLIFFLRFEFGYGNGSSYSKLENQRNRSRMVMVCTSTPRADHPWEAAERPAKIRCCNKRRISSWCCSCRCWIFSYWSWMPIQRMARCTGDDCPPPPLLLASV
jgi:hypothetical protein